VRRREQDGLPAVTIRDLLKAALRHRPDRIIVEIRGGEAFDLLQLLNTGHSGTLSTEAAQGISRFHDVCAPEWRREAVPCHQEYRGLAQHHRPDRTSSGYALCF